MKTFKSIPVHLRNLLASLALSLLFSTVAFAQSTYSPAVKSSELKTKLSYLASDQLEGRMTGSKGAKLAAQYIVDEYNSLGLKTLANHKEFLWPFDFVSDVKVDKANNTFQYENVTYELYKDFAPLISTENGELDAEVVFAGYGVKVEEGDFTYNSYQSIKVKDKIVMVLDGMPEELDKEKEKLFEITLASGYKQMLARQMGAKGILIIHNRVSQKDSEVLMGSSGIITMAISEKMADTLLASVDFSVEEAKKFLSGGVASKNKHLFSLKKNIQIKTHLQKIMGKDNNIIAVIPAQKSDAPYLFIGAHYDHLGFGEINSRAKGIHKDFIHNGADDNASGTVSVLELAEYFMDIYTKNPEKIEANLVFCHWSGEEMGLLGSAAFTQQLPIDAKKIKAYVNYDMVGSLRKNKLEIQGIGSATEWKELFDTQNKEQQFDILYGNDPYLPTDVTSFYLKQIPVVNFFTGIQDRYHTDLDDTEYIEFDGLEKIVDFSTGLIFSLMQNNLTYQKAKMHASRTKRSNISVSLGTIPQYSGGDGTGMLLQGVSNGGAAEEAGLQANDKIIELNGKEIKNIYDFMNILGELKPNIKTTIKVVREGKKLELPLIPHAKGE